MAEYIKREAVLALVKEIHVKEVHYRTRMIDPDEVRELPAADVQPVRHGRWKGGHERGSFSHPDSITYKCSECGYSIYTIYGFPYLPKYCSNCGTKMEVDE